MGHDDAAAGQPSEVDGLLAGQVADDAVGHVADVGEAVADVGVVDLAEGFGVMLNDEVEDELGVALLPADLRNDFLDQHLVADQHEMGVEDAGVLLPQNLGHALPQLLELLDRKRQRGLEAADFLLHLVGVERDFLDRPSLGADDEGAGDDNAGGNPDPRKYGAAPGARPGLSLRRTSP